MIMIIIIIIMLVVDVAHNAFTGSVPSNLRKLRNLRTMNLGAVDTDIQRYYPGRIVTNDTYQVRLGNSKTKNIGSDSNRASDRQSCDRRYKK
jgi:hypothetical protein